MKLLYFPLNCHTLALNSSPTHCTELSAGVLQLPLSPHPGAFAVKRKHHTHEGVDLYCPDKTPVICPFDCEVVDIFDFTGEKANTPWWNDTQSLLLKSVDSRFNYSINLGEIEVSESLYKGVSVKAGQCVGWVKTVLKKDKGRPMSMLHLELYEPTSTCVSSGWYSEEKPDLLIDPTQFLLSLAEQCNIKIIPSCV